MGRTACTEPQCLYNGALYLTSPYTKNVEFPVTAKVIKAAFSILVSSQFVK